MSKVLKTVGQVAGVVALTLAIPGAGAALGFTTAATKTAIGIATVVS